MYYVRDEDGKTIVIASRFEDAEVYAVAEAQEGKVVTIEEVLPKVVDKQK
jgi:hypothetical protein